MYDKGRLRRETVQNIVALVVALALWAFLYAYSAVNGYARMRGQPAPTITFQIAEL